jgi:hypothetical protein
MALKARRPVPTSKASGASSVEEKTLPVSASVEALLFALAVSPAVAVAAVCPEGVRSGRVGTSAAVARRRRSRREARFR